MDNVTIDVGTPPAAATGDAAVLIGAQGLERITAEEIARRLGTINYEVTCGLLPRVPREHHRDGEPAALERGPAAAPSGRDGDVALELERDPAAVGSASGRQPHEGGS
jgi:alanine racemase